MLPAFAGRCAPATSQIVSSPAAPLGMIGNEDMPAILPPTRFSTNGPTLFHCRPKVVQFGFFPSPSLDSSRFFAASRTSLSTTTLEAPVCL